MIKFTRNFERVSINKNNKFCIILGTYKNSPGIGLIVVYTTGIKTGDFINDENGDWVYGEYKKRVFYKFTYRSPHKKIKKRFQLKKFIGYIPINVKINFDNYV